jgi:ABC-2 type transport system permease protein
MKRFFGVMSVYFKASMKSKFEYRGAFVFDIIGCVLGYGTQFLLIWVLISRFELVNGWKAFEVMLLYSMSIVSYTLANIFLRGPVGRLNEKLLTGHFDQTLTKPMNPLAYEIASAFSSQHFIQFLCSINMLVICFLNLDVQMNFVKIVLLAVFIIGSSLIVGGMMILFNSVSFWSIGGNPLAFQLLWSFRQLIEYPLSLYPGVLQVLLTVIVPFGFISFYPAQFFLAKDDFLMFSPVLQYLNPLVGVLVACAAFFVWNLGVKRYNSSGS